MLKHALRTRTPTCYKNTKERACTIKPDCTREDCMLSRVDIRENVTHGIVALPPQHFARNNKYLYNLK